MKLFLTTRGAAFWVALVIAAIFHSSIESSAESVKDELSADVFKEPCEVKANFTFQISGCKVYFFDKTIKNSSTTVTNWYWNFGDGSTSNVQNPVHTFPGPGTYTICLTVVGTNGIEQCKSRICKTITVYCQAICEVKADFKFTIDKCNVKFTDLSTNNAFTTITGWQWSFGDGNVSTLQNPIHNYSASGLYKVCLIVYGKTATGQECKSEICKEIQVNCAEPCELKPAFDFNVNNCTVKLQDLSAAGSGTTITGWFWSFGDGATSTLQNPVHTYSGPGIYPVCLYIKGKNGNTTCISDSVCKEVRVYCENGPCEVKADFKDSVVNCKVFLTDVSATNLWTSIISWSWDFGDGNTSNVQNPTHTYAASGPYKICLKVTGINPEGQQCTSFICREVQVNCETGPCEVKPNFDFSVDNCTAKFTNLSTSNPFTVVTSYLWSFDDGTTSTLQNPVHTYTGPGVYKVCLTVYGSNGQTECKETVCKEVRVYCESGPCEVKADFKYTTENCKVSFTEISSTNIWTAKTAWLWSFGDGGGSNVANPVHTFTAPGTYKVCLITYAVGSDGNECKDDTCMYVTVDCLPGTTSQVSISPVPTSDVTDIELDLKRSGNVKIYVVDLTTGKQVAEIANGQLNIGSYKFSWKPDASVRKGNYSVIVVTPEGINHKRAVLIK